MSVRQVIQQLQNDSSVETLVLEAYSDADSFVDELLNALAERCNIKRLLLRTEFFMEISDEHVNLFMSSLGNIPDLEFLEIESSSRFHIDIIPAESLRGIKEASKLHTLRLLDLQVTAASGEFMEALASAVHCHPSLNQVIFSNFFANDHNNTMDHVLDPLLDSLASIPNLRHLEVTGCGSHALTGQQLPLVSPKAVAKIVAMKTLYELDLSFLEMTDEHFQSLAVELAKYNESRLTTLSLNYHNLGNIGFQSVMEALATNSSLISLSMRALKDIGAIGFDQAMTMLQQNYWIQNLSVTADPIQQAKIDLYLRLNEAGRSLLRNPSTTMNQWIDILAEISDDVDATRHLLQEIPFLCLTTTRRKSTVSPCAVESRPSPAA